MDDELRGKVNSVAMAEVGRKQWGWFYLSWADETDWLGGMFIQAFGPITARLRVKAMNISPGGQCAIFRFPLGTSPPPMDYTNRLLTKEEFTAAYPDAKALKSWKEEES